MPCVFYSVRVLQFNMFELETEPIDKLAQIQTNPGILFNKKQDIK